ncbi:MAG: hypothetical protein JKY54_15135 [Flavobacteriales bacterium]|nr:hypothetical protein [Flavobacteriales bacterium]
MYRYLVFLIFLIGCGSEESTLIDLPIADVEAPLAEDLQFNPIETSPDTLIESSRDTLVVTTENQTAGINAVIDFYGGTCKKSTGIQAEGNNKGRFFELEIYDSEHLATYLEVPEIPSATIAYLFFNALEEELTSLDFIRASIHFEGNKKSTSEYSIKDLKLIKHKLAIVDQLNERIAKKEYEAIRPMFSDEIYEFPKDEFIDNMEAIEEISGKPTGYKLFSFQFYELAESETAKVSDNADNQRILHISYTLLRDKQSHECSVEFIADENKDQIIQIKYRY